MNWSHFQTDIFNAFTNTSDSLLIEAVAGSGKTTVLIELAKLAARYFPHLRIVFLAFNKSICEELNRRLLELGITNVIAVTLHSAGWSAWRRAGGLDWEPQVDTLKTHKIMREVLSYEEVKRFGETTQKLVAAAKGIGLVPAAQWYMGGNYKATSFSSNLKCSDVSGLVADTPEAWEALMDHYGLDEDECRVDCARRVLARSIELGKEVVDFDDMLFLPVIAGVPFDRYDVVLVDEAQDVSGIQMEMISRMAGLGRDPYGQEYTKGRVIAVGDRKQSIYGFRGAGTDSMDIFKRRFQMRELPLSVTYRCPRAVVLHARQWVPQLEWSDTADFGFVGHEGTDWAGQAEIALEGISKWKGIRDLSPGDAVLCRLTRPLVAAAFAMIRNRIPCRVLGRDIGAGLVQVVKKGMKSLKDGTVGAFGRWLDDYEQQESQRLVDRGKRAQVGLLGDRADTLRVFMDEMVDETPVTALIAEIERLFVDANGNGAGMVTLATVHKAKGLEYDRVFVLDAGEFMPCPWARRDGWEMQQERNCMYIAATRAKRELRYIKTSDLI